MQAQRNDATGTRSVRLTADEVAVLDNLVRLNATCVGEKIEYAKNAEDLAASIQRAQVHLALMRGAETGHLELTEPVVERLRSFRVETLETIEDNRTSLQQLRASGGAHDFCYVGATAAESEQMTLTAIDSELDEMNALDALLAHCPEGEATR